MKKEARLLRDKAINSLVLSIEAFNRPWDRGRSDAVLIFLDHGFEMLLKSAILHRGGKIRKLKDKETIGFDSCVRVALDDGKIKFIESEDALTLQMINGLRDAAQHHLVDLSEQQLYMHAQAGLTLFRDLLRRVFSDELTEHVPLRVLPVSTQPPLDLAALFDNESEQIKQLLLPRSRRRTEAAARLRALSIIDGSIQGEHVQPSEAHLKRLMTRMKEGLRWQNIFPGVAGIELKPEGSGPALNLRLTKKEGIPVQLVREGTPGAGVVAVRRVDELGFYNLGRDQLAKKVKLTGPKTTAAVRFLEIKKDAECYKDFEIGRMRVARYSQKAIDKIQKALQDHTIEDIWASHGIRSSRNEETRSLSTITPLSPTLPDSAADRHPCRDTPQYDTRAVAAARS